MSTMWMIVWWFFTMTRLERTTNGSGYLGDHDFEYLRSLDAGAEGADPHPWGGL